MGLVVALAAFGASLGPGHPMMITAVLSLGPAPAVLVIDAADRHLFGSGGVLAIRFAGRL